MEYGLVEHMQESMFLLLYQCGQIEEARKICSFLDI